VQTRQRRVRAGFALATRVNATQKKVGTDAIGEARARQDEAIKKIQEGKLKREQGIRLGLARARAC